MLKKLVWLLLIAPLISGCFHSTSMYLSQPTLSTETQSKLEKSAANLQKKTMNALKAGNCAGLDDLCFGKQVTPIVDQVFIDAGYSMNKMIQLTYALKSQDGVYHTAYAKRLGFDKLLFGPMMAMATKEGRAWLVKENYVSEDTIQMVPEKYKTPF